MFAARTALRASRFIPLSRPSRQFTTARSWLQKHDKTAEHEIPVVSYSSTNDNPQHDVIKVDQLKPVASPVSDVLKKASPLDHSVIKNLTPTLSKFTLGGKVALVTGAARGLGWNMAQALSEVGAKAIALIDVQQEIGDAAAAELYESTGIPTQFYQVDIRDGAAISKVVSKVAEEFGSLDVVINSAGVADSNIKAEEYETAMFRRLIDINVTGAFLVAQACGQQMIKQGTGGSIILVASMSGTIVNYPQPQCCYNASKAAVIQLTKSLAVEWAQHGIRVNAISPGYMDTALNRVPALEAQKKIWTSMTPMGRLGNVHELNNLAVYLASDASSLMTGANCIIDGGYTLL